MSCGYGTRGFKCDQIYTLGGTVSQARAIEIYHLGQKLGLTEFNPTSVNWDAPISWKGVLLGGAGSSNSSLISGLNSAAAAVNAAIAADAAKRALDQKEMSELLSVIPSIAGLALNIGDLTNSLLAKQKCVKGKTIKYVKKGTKCPKGYAKRK